MEERAYLGIDWGAADVGVALADPETRIALGLTTLQNDATLPIRVAEIVEREQVGTIVIGTPSHIDRKEMEDKGEIFGKLLRKHVPDQVRIVYENEMFTTKMAQYNLRERGTKHASKHDDVEAARIILQAWLEKKEGTVSSR